MHIYSSAVNLSNRSYPQMVYGSQSPSRSGADLANSNTVTSRHHILRKVWGIEGKCPCLYYHNSLSSTYICRYTVMYICIYVYKQIYRHIDLYTHIYIYIYMHMHIHIYYIHIQ